MKFEVIEQRPMKLYPGRAAIRVVLKRLPVLRPEDHAAPAKSERVTGGGGGMSAKRSPCHSHHALSFRALVLAGMIWMFSGTLSPQIKGCVSGTIWSSTWRTPVDRVSTSRR